MSAPTFVPASPPGAGFQGRPPERPTGAFVSGLLGGIAILVFSVLEIDLGASCQGSGTCYFAFGGAPEVYIASGILGAVVGAMAILFATLAYVQPEHRVLAGVMLIVFSILSLISFWGGFGIGFIATLIGGILAIAWRPGPEYIGYQPVFPAGYRLPRADGPAGLPAGSATRGGSAHPAGLPEVRPLGRPAGEVLLPLRQHPAVGSQTPTNVGFFLPPS